MFGGCFNRLWDFALIECGGTFFGDGFQRVSQVGLHQAIARLQRRTVFTQEDFGRFRVLLEACDGGVENVGIGSRQDKALTGQPDGRFHHLLAAQLAVLFTRGLHSQHRSRHASGQITI
ncbi:hypothetical protein D3C75_918510 [compost metagenome]